MDGALEIATNLAPGSHQAIQGAEHSLNKGWLTARCPSIKCQAREVIGLTSADYPEARRAFRAKQPPRFPSGSR